MLIAMEPMLWIPEGMPGAGGYREHDIVGLNKVRAENSIGYLYVLAHNIL
jgi:creatinase